MVSASDVLNRLLSTTNPKGETVLFAGGIGVRVQLLTEKIRDTGARGFLLTASTYETLERLFSTTNAKGESTQFAFGGAAFGDGTFGSNLVRLTDARGRGTGFTFDLRNRGTRGQASNLD